MSASKIHRVAILGLMLESNRFAPVITEETAEFCDFHLPDLRVRVASVFHNIIPCGNVYQSTKTVFAIAAAFGGV
mgnify:CR=1 FL=1